MAESMDDRIRKGLIHLGPAKERLVTGSDRASRDMRDCATCDAHCCKVGFNSMLVSRIEAHAIAERLREEDLADRIPAILRKARREVDRRGLRDDETANFDCPLLDEEGRCLVHGPAQPAGCLTFQPVSDGGCDHDLDAFDGALPRIEAAERKAFGRVADPEPIPVAILRVLGRDRRGRRG
jgi:hypothetical protein